MKFRNESFVDRRKAQNLTQRQVAQSIGVTERTYQSWELGENIPHLDPLRMLRLCQALQCSLEDLARDFFPEEFEVNDGEGLVEAFEPDKVETQTTEHK